MYQGGIRCRRPSRSASTLVDSSRGSQRGSTCLTHAAVPTRNGVDHMPKQAKVQALPMPDDVKRGQQQAGGPLPGGQEGKDIAWDIGRRSAVVAAVGAGAMWLLAPVDTAIDSASSLSMPLALAEDACVEAAAVCSTVHSQMSSTLRQLSAGYLSEDLFQATCKRRLSSPFFTEVLQTLPDALPALGNHLAYRPDLSGSGRFLAAIGKPVVDQARSEHIEELTLTALQRSRRALRLSKAMANVKYTPAGVQLLTQDVRYVNSALNELIKEKAMLQAQL